MVNLADDIKYDLEFRDSTKLNERVLDIRATPFSCLYSHSSGSWRILGSFSPEEDGILSLRPIRTPTMMEDVSLTANIYETLRQNNEIVFTTFSNLKEGYIVPITYVNFVSGRNAKILVSFDGACFKLNDISLPGRLRYTEGDGGKEAYATDIVSLQEEMFRLTLEE